MSVVAVEEVYAQLSEDLQQVERILAEVAASHIEFIPRALGGPLSSRGKRLRPVLVLLSAKAVSDPPPPASVEIAAAAEAIHLSGLILDDVIDQAELRRGQKTLHQLWGNEIPVLLAAFVLSRTCTRLAAADFQRPLAVLAASTTRMCEGELTEVLNRHNLKVTESHYLATIEAKTASLFSACCEVGALIAGGTPRACKALAEGGREFGIAFQIADDVLDFLGEEQVTGKRPGRDLGCGRVTLPLIHALRLAGAGQRAQMEALLCAGEGAEQAYGREAAARLEHVLTFIKEHGGFEYAQQAAHAHTEKAKELFAALPASCAREALLTLTDYALTRRG